MKVRRMSAIGMKARRSASLAPMTVARAAVAWATLAFATVALVGCGNRQPGATLGGPGGFGGFGDAGSPVTALPVITELVQIGTISSFLTATTTLSAENSIDVIAGVSGPVTQVLVEEGDAVVRGQLLAAIDRTDAELSLREAQTHYDNTKRSYDRTAALAERNAASNDDVEKLQYDLEIRELALIRAQQTLDDTQVRAPIDGVIANRAVQIAVNVAANASLFTVVDMDPLLAIVHIPEVNRGQVRVGQRVVVEAERGTAATGTLVRVSPVVDPGSGTVKVTIEIVGQSFLLPGMFVTVRVPVETRRDVLVIPKRAVLIERDQSVIYRVRGTGALRSPVELGLSSGDIVEVRSGLDEGDSIVTVGQESLQDGMAVREAGQPIAVAEPSAGGGPPASSAAPPRGAVERDATAEDAQPPAQAGARGQQGGGQRGGFRGRTLDLSQMPVQQRERFEQLLLQNEQIKTAYDEKLKEDPDLATDADKRATFFTEQIEAAGGPQALFAGRGQAAGGGGARGGFGGSAF